MELDWIFVGGGVCRFGDRGRPLEIHDLWWSKTPITWHQASVQHLEAPNDAPVTYVSFDRASDIAAALGGRLPRSSEWEWMASGTARRLFPWGNDDWTPAHGNLRSSGILRTVPVGSFPIGATTEGILDVAGNVWEWTTSRVFGNGFVIRGGSYASPPLYARTRFLNGAPRELCSPGLGLRIVKDRL